jgi:nucleoid DNA-binding protein
MNKQQKILITVAKNHGITIGQAEEIWSLFGEKIATTISSPKKNEEGQFILDKFDTIHIDNFGKFVPNKRKINYANHCIKLKQQQ